MDKPTTLSVKDFLIRKMSSDMFIKKTVIEQVVSHQFSTMTAAMRVHNSVEMSGFGRFYYNKGRAQYKLVKHLMQRDNFCEWLLQDHPERWRKRLQLKLGFALDDIKEIVPHLEKDDRFQEIIRRVAQSPSPPGGAETGDPQGGSGEDGAVPGV